LPAAKTDADTDKGPADHFIKVFADPDFRKDGHDLLPAQAIEHETSEGDDPVDAQQSAELGRIGGVGIDEPGKALGVVRFQA
jgi:hypothetical protein